MNSHYDSIGEAGLQFFGKMSSSIAHEIKNTLAIINENAGLLEDLTFMAQKGMAIDPERLQRMAQNLLKQVRRADGIIKNMSHFAHSVDEFEKCVDLYELVRLVAVLSGRFADMRGVSLEMVPAKSPIMLTTNPFLLENLVWLCLDFAMGATDAGKTVDLIPEKNDSEIRLIILKLDGIVGACPNHFPTERVNALLSALKAKLTVDIEKGELILLLSEKGEK